MHAGLRGEQFERREHVCGHEVHGAYMSAVVADIRLEKVKYVSEQIRHVIFFYGTQSHAGRRVRAGVRVEDGEPGADPAEEAPARGGRQGAPGGPQGRLEVGGPKGLAERADRRDVQADEAALGHHLRSSSSSRLCGRRLWCALCGACHHNAR